jgi:hypothetical protein
VGADLQVHTADAGDMVCLFACIGVRIRILLGFPEKYKVTDDCADTDFLSGSNVQSVPDVLSYSSFRNL